MSSIYALLRLEEGWRSKPYLCTENYPTVGFGFRIGPKGADITLYQFSLPVRAGEAWLDTLLSNLEVDMRRDPKFASGFGVLASLSGQPAVWLTIDWFLPTADALARMKEKLK